MPAVNEKKYTVVGVSTLNGEKTFRFATGKPETRAGVLKRNKHEDIELFVCPEGTKLECAKWFMNEHPGKARGCKMPAGRKLKTIKELEDEAEAKANPKPKARKSAKAKDAAEAAA